MLGRDYEKSIIQRAISSQKAELGIVYGRRRVGKSTLLKSLLRPGDLYFEGIKGLSKKAQIKHFVQQLAEQTGSMPVAANSWQDAFDALTPYVVAIQARGASSYVVFDELPWMASERSELVAFLKYYWDQKWKQNTALTLVLCGSIAQFMVKHVIHSEALHNRKTFEIKLEAMMSKDSQKFFHGKRSHLEITQFLMIFGGIPKYLEQINPSSSLSVNLDRLCFTKSGFFVTEFESIFKEQFKTTQTYAKIVRSLNPGSLTKEQLSDQLKIKTGGGLTSYLDNLERADFVKKQSSINLAAGEKKKTAHYVLWDEWLRFYFRYVDPHLKIIQRQERSGLYRSLAGNSIQSFYGLSFEQFCMKNIDAIFSALNIDISDVLNFGPYFRQGGRGASSGKLGHSQQGVQVDLLIQRRDRVLTLVECKFKDEPIGLGIIPEIERKVSLLGAHAQTQMSIERVLVSSSGVNAGLAKSGYFNHVLDLDIFY